VRRLPVSLPLAVALSAALFAGVYLSTSRVEAQSAQATLTQAPAGFDNLPNGLTDSTTFTADKTVFEEVEKITDGLGPVYNAQSCRECHQNPVTGAISQIREFRAGHNSNGSFVGATVTLRDNNGNNVTIANRSLINQRAICPAVDASQVVNGVPFSFPNAYGEERISTAENIRTDRTSLNTLGDGFIESVADTTLIQLANNQCNSTGGRICGLAIEVPVLEMSGATAVGRFGWKDQHASLLSFSSDAYLNEMGITNRLNPDEVTPNCDITPDPEDHTGSDGLADIDHFARFMRATKTPPRDALLMNTSDAIAGANLFHAVGCDICHVTSMNTAAPGTAVDGGAFVVPPSLGNKTFHPYSDFLLHNLGTGDGIVQTGGQQTANRMRTPPLWGVRMRNQLMHDGANPTFFEAIQRHGGEASPVTNNFNSLSITQQNQLITFLLSL
jgi:CxxC motif-containing protein (DUF1111 family)